MLKKNVKIIGLLACLLANVAWAGNASFCLTRDGNYLKNICPYDVEAVWCFGMTCGFDHGSSTWTIRGSSAMPIDASKHNEYLKYDACQGANSIKKFNSYGVDCR